MTNTYIPPLPVLDDMLQSLLLIEEGEHEFSAEENGIQELRQLFFPVTRSGVYLNHAATGPISRPVAQIMRECVSDYSEFGMINEERWRMHQQGVYRRFANFIHARPEQTALTMSSSDGLMHIAQGLDWLPRDHICTSEGEFPSNVYP